MSAWLMSMSVARRVLTFTLNAKQVKKNEQRGKNKAANMLPLEPQRLSFSAYNHTATGIGGPIVATGCLCTKFFLPYTCYCFQKRL